MCFRKVSASCAMREESEGSELEAGDTLNLSWTVGRKDDEDRIGGEQLGLGLEGHDGSASEDQRANPFPYVPHVGSIPSYYRPVLSRDFTQAGGYINKEGMGLAPHPRVSLFSGAGGHLNLFLLHVILF